MASVKLYLDTRVPRKDGTYPLKIAVTHKGKFLINLKIYLTEDQFVENEVVGHKSKKTYNIVIEQWLVNIKKILLDLGANGKLNKLSHQQLKDIIENYTGNDDPDDDEKPYLFKDHAELFLSLNDKKKSTKELYEYTITMIGKYADIDTLTFDDIDYNWLEGFNDFLIPTCKINSRSVHLRNVRAIFKHATKKKLVSKDLYPFDDFPIKEEETKHRNLSIDDLILIRDYPVEPHQQRYRDLFMLLFYTIGINMIDILHATGLNGNRLEYRREKTGKLYDIEILPEAAAIIKKYSPGEKYLLNFLDTYKNYKDFLHRTNDNLKEIGPFEWVETKTKTGRITKKKKRQPLFPYLTTYYARHTWASLASDLDIPKETIVKALGHGKKVTSDIYINFDRKKIDDANKKVMKYIKEYNSKKKKASQK